MSGFYGQDYDDDGNPVTPGPQVVCLADVEPERVTWLWPGYLPLGKLVTLDGDPGVGKSSVTLDLAARVSTGSPMPDGTAPVKGAVLILSAEDGLADTIRPRLDAAAADPAQIITITEITSYVDGERYTRPVSIPGDLQAIGEIITEHQVVLVIIDVLMAYLSADVNSHRDQDVRRALHVLASMAERSGCTVIVLRHLNKASGGNAVYRGGGSIGIIGAARAGFMCGTDPDDDTGNSRVLAPVKCNLAQEPPALAYRLVDDELHGCASIVWDGVSAHKAARLLAEPADPDERTQRGEAAEWLTGYLTDNGGEATAGDVLKAGHQNGFAERTVQRARHSAGVVSRKAGFKGAWMWALDVTPPPPRRHEGDKDASSNDMTSTSPSVSPSAAETQPELGEAPSQPGTTFISAAELRTHMVFTTDGNGKRTEPWPETDLRGSPIGDQAQVWEFDRLVYPRVGAKRRVRQHVKILHCPEGWHSRSGSADTPYGLALCSTLMDDKWTSAAGGLDRDQFHAFHDQHPVVWAAEVRMYGACGIYHYCDPELPDEYREHLS